MRLICVTMMTAKRRKHRFRLFPEALQSGGEEYHEDASRAAGSEKEVFETRAQRTGFQSLKVCPDGQRIGLGLAQHV